MKNENRLHSPDSPSTTKPPSFLDLEPELRQAQSQATCLWSALSGSVGNEFAGAAEAVANKLTTINDLYMDIHRAQGGDQDVTCHPGNGVDTVQTQSRDPQLYAAADAIAHASAISCEVAALLEAIQTSEVNALEAKNSAVGVRRLVETLSAHLERAETIVNGARERL